MLKKRPYLFLILFIIVAMIVVIFFALRRAPVFAALPNPNGYDDFAKAGAAIVGQPGDTADFTQDQLRSFIISNSTSLSLMRTGLTRSCSVPTESSMTNQSRMWSDLPNFKKLAWLAEAEGRLAESESRPLDAAYCYIDAMRFGNEISRGGFLIHRLVGVACNSIGSKRLSVVARKLDCSEIRKLILELENLDANLVSWTEVRENETLFVRHELRKMSNPIKMFKEALDARVAIENTGKKHKQMIASLRLLITEMALHCYQVDHGRVPDRLDQLTLLKRLPLDPFSARLLVYHPQGNELGAIQRRARWGG